MNGGSLPRLQLKRHEDRRIRRGHHWVYSNEIDVGATPLKAFAPGQAAVLQDARAAPLGIVHVNPNALICARLLDRDASRRIDRAWLVGRLRRALLLRERLYAAPYYRLVYGDSDGLSGLVVDRFGEHLVIQIGTAGMEALKDELVAALEQVLSPRSVTWRNDASIRDMEGLPSYVGPATGVVPSPLAIEENGVKFHVDVAAGQKTGWFYDHRENRDLAARLAVGARVLDVFSYVGGWGVQAAVAGARSVTCIDSSAAALELAADNAGYNDVAGRVTTLCGDASERLRDLVAAGERYDLVVLDPPALIKRRKDTKAGEAAYRRINQFAMQLLGDDGVLVSASCSMHLAEDALLEVVRDAGQRAGKLVQVFARGGQGGDHPVHPAMPETRYLKALFCRVIG